MNYQPSEYLSELNLVFDHVDRTPVDESSHSVNLDYFSQADFFDLDVFSNDFGVREKGGMPAKFSVQQQESVVPMQQVTVKLEDNDGTTLAGSFGSHASSSNESSNMASPNSSVPTDDTTTEDAKRRRNTAASARFRIKKKLKEKQMEEHTRELEARLGLLEKKLRTLEMENKCLRQLIVEKTEKKNCDLLESIKKRSLYSGSNNNGLNTSFTYTN